MSEQSNYSIDTKPPFDFLTRVFEMIFKATGLEARSIRSEGKARAEVRLLGAETDAAIVLKQADTDIAKAEKYRAAALRMVHNALREQANLEALVEQLISLLPSEAPTGEMPSDDTIHHAFEHAKHVSDEKMRSLWANLLAAEFCKPGSFSKKTINIVADLEPKDARDFAFLSRFVWVYDVPTPIIRGLQSDFLIVNGINFHFLKHLETLGLISFTFNQVNNIKLMADGSLKCKGVEISYFGEPFHFTEELDRVMTGCVRFTRAGQELFTLCKPDPIPEVIERELRYCEKVKRPLARGPGFKKLSEFGNTSFHLDT